jgi:hypothetical protein
VHWSSAKPVYGSSDAQSSCGFVDAVSQRYAQVIDITHLHLGAGAAMVQPFFFCASNHSIEPGWGTV